VPVGASSGLALAAPYAYPYAYSAGDMRAPERLHAPRQEAYTATLDEAAAKAAVKAVLDTTAAAKKAAKTVGDNLASGAAAKALQRKVDALLTEPWRVTLTLLPRATQCQVIISAFKQLVAQKMTARVVVTQRALESAHLVGSRDVPRAAKDADAWYRTLKVDAPSLQGAVSVGDATASARAWKDAVDALTTALPPGFVPSEYITGLLRRTRRNAAAAPAVLLELHRYVEGIPGDRSGRQHVGPYYAYM
jgi:hypothetical protein